MMKKIIEVWTVERWLSLPLDYRIKIKSQWKKRELIRIKKGRSI
jgi:hypothetical protein